MRFNFRITFLILSLILWKKLKFLPCVLLCMVESIENLAIYTTNAVLYAPNHLLHAYVTSSNLITNFTEP